MRRISLWFMSTGTALVLLFGYHTSTSSTAADGSIAIAAPSGSGSSSTAGSGSSASTSGGSTAAAGGSRTVTGSSASTRWGPVQVRLTVANGKITDVSVIQYPSNNRRDQEINAEALPILVKETLTAQNASIHMVSGATVTSEGYLTSLQSALDQAGL